MFTNMFFFCRNGYHRAYTEIFNLVENRRSARELAGPGSEMSLEIILEENSSYIDKLKYHLCEGKRHLVTAMESFENYHIITPFFYIIFS